MQFRGTDEKCNKGTCSFVGELRLKIDPSSRTITITMLTVPEKSLTVTRILEEKRVEEQRMHDVLLLIQHLVEQEETTITMILDCLYDVGAVNLINNKFRFKPLNKVMKYIAKLSKPAFRVVALRWFKKNCPELITNWLKTKVTF